VWPMQHPVTYSVIWIGIILAVFIPVSTRRFTRTSGRT
jgi:ABC-2 type transport system permease protein